MDRVVYCTTKLKCGSDKAFEMFVINKHLEKWLTHEADVEAEVGGKYELFWNPEDKENDSTLGCRVLAIRPNKFLSFEWKGPKHFKHLMNEIRPLTNVVVFFLPDDGETEVHLVHTGWGETPEWEQAYKWFEKAWVTAFSELQSYVNKIVE